MAVVFIPALLRPFIGQETTQAEGATVAAIIDDLDRQFPGVKSRLIDGTRLRPNLAVAVDGEVSPEGLKTKVDPASEVHFVLALSGG